MPKKKPVYRPRLLDVVLTSLVSLFLVAVVMSTAGVGRLLPGGADSVGPVGRWIGEVTFQAIGPWLAWGLALLPWAWIPLRNAGSKTIALRRVAITVGTILALAALLGHDQLVRLGVPTESGGQLGEWAENAVEAVIGSLGSFLLLASIGAWLLLRQLPPLHFSLPALDGLTSRTAAVGGWFGHGLIGFRDLIGAWVSAAFDRMSEARAAWSEERAEQRRARQESDALVAAGAAEPGPLARRARTKAAAADEELVEEELEEGVDDEYEEYEEGDEDGEYEEDDEYEEYDEDEDEAEDAGEEDEVDRPAAVAEARVVEASEAGIPSWARGLETADGEFRLSRDPSELLANDAEPKVRKPKRRRGDLPLPALDCLAEVEKEQRGYSRDVLQMNARLLLETLANFGIEGQINEIRPGPVVTTFEFEPAPGVKVSQIVSRADDLALAMRAMRIRIEAPIPGKAAVGIEIPNPYPQTVALRQVLSALSDDPATDPLEIAFGKDTEGEPFSADLSDMPHLLVAGATGSGKSVCINAIIVNLLLRNGPDRVRLLMIDPKMLELSVYNGIPHLMHPVITQAGDALKAVKYMVAEMETRYSKLSKHSVRNIKDYNAKVKKGEAIDPKSGEKIKDTLPYCVFIIDELADLMMQLGNDLETPIARLAQMARAVGIHLVLATQRPSVNVITGVIKANFPSRIGFRVISKIDSRTILDGGGAEALLGKGDMLFLLAGRAQPVRVHGAYVSMEECEAVVAHWQKYEEDEPDHIDLDAGSRSTGGVDLGEDELLDQARDMVIATQMGSTTMLQRRLRVGYTRAARLMDMLEASGVVGPFEGSKARKVLVERDELQAED